jgi:hypothetical protein
VAAVRARADESCEVEVTDVSIISLKVCMYRAGDTWEFVDVDSRHAGDTYLHSWEMLVKILTHEDCRDILLDIGM